MNPDNPWSQRAENGFIAWPKSVSLISLMPKAEMAPGMTNIKSARSRLIFRKPLYLFISFIVQRKKYFVKRRKRGNIGLCKLLQRNK